MSSQPTPGRPRTRRDEILAYICVYARAHNGNSPTIREVAAHFGLSHITVYHHLLKLQAEERLALVDDKWVVDGARWFGPEGC